MEIFADNDDLEYGSVEDRNNNHKTKYNDWEDQIIQQAFLQNMFMPQNSIDLEEF